MEDILDKYSSVITDYEVIAWDSQPTSYRFKARINFTDGSRLTIRDYLFSSGRKYAYHWQDENNNLKCRWDNAPHWREIDTFPHHRHEQTGVFSSREVTLEEVLRYIQENIIHNQNRQ